MGIMPSEEVKKRKRIKVGQGQLTIEIQAGENGWTLIFADLSTEYKDVVDTVDNNFNAALKVAKSYFTITEPVF